MEFPIDSGRFVDALTAEPAGCATPFVVAAAWRIRFSISCPLQFLADMLYCDNG